MSPETLAWIVGAVAVIGAILTYVLLLVDRRWAVAAGLLVILVLVAVFAYTTSFVFASLDAGLYEESIAYQRLAAGELAALTFIAGLLALGYYMELVKGGHEG